MKKTLVCINCPAGCRLEVSQENETVTVTGNHCPRGKAWAENELRDPRRIVTAAAKTDSAALPYLPVRTSVPVPLRMVSRILLAVYALRVEAPVRRGEALIRDFEGSGIDVTASRTLPE